MSRMSTLLAVMAAAAAAVLASAGASAAEVKASAYADLSFGVDHFEFNGGTADTIFQNHGSYWGLKGSTMVDGMTAFGAFDKWLAVDTSDTKTGSLGGLYTIDVPTDTWRQGYIGLNTKFGTVQAGTFTTAYANAGQKLDPFVGSAAAGAEFGSGGISHGQSNLSADRNAYGTRLSNVLGPTFANSAVAGGIAGNQVAYTSPTMFGLTANVAVLFDEGSGASSRGEDFAAGIEWSGLGGVTAGVQYLDANSTAGNLGLYKGEEAMKAYAGYTAQRFGANVSAERVDHNGTTTVNGFPIIGGFPPALMPGLVADSTYAQANAWFGVLPNTRVAASYGMENETGTEGTSFRVGVFHDCMDNFTLNLTYLNYDAKTEQQPNTLTGNLDTQVISMGATYRFELGAMTTTK